MINKFKQLLSDKQYGKLALIVIFALAAIAATVLVTYFVGKLLVDNFDTIALGISILAVAFYFIHKFFANREEARIHSAAHRKEVIKATEKQQHDIDLMTAENNYSAVGKCLFAVLKDAAATLSLVAPTSLSDLEPQIRVSDNGSYILLHYVCQKRSDVDTDIIKEVLNNRIAQKLRADEFHHLSDTYCNYDGRNYPIIMVDDVIDVKAYVNIDMVMTNKAYCEHLCNKSVAERNYTDFKDIDF